MRRTAGILLFLAAIIASVYAWRSMSDLVSLGGNAAVRYQHESLVWHLRWALITFGLTIAYVATARRFWRFAAIVPLAISATVACLIVWVDVSASA